MKQVEREQQAEWEAQLYENLQTLFVHTGGNDTSLVIQGASVRKPQHGLVLISGGYEGWSSSPSTEILDYQRNSVQRGPDMKVARSSHASVTLLSGDIAVFGGGNKNVEPKELASCEVFNVKSLSFSEIGNMIEKREGPAAVLLPNGLVFIVGGLGKHEYLKSCEFYNAVDKTFTASKAKMSVGRIGHTASLLPNGKVLVCGGIDGYNALRTTEIYDPLTDSFSAGPRTTVRRTLHTATALLDGRILVAGGAPRPHLPAEIYDTTANSFSYTARTVVARDSHFSVLLPDGRVLLGGGMSKDSRKTTEIYDPKTNSFTWGAWLFSRREDASASLF